jgi:hypothetical protein
MQPEKYQYTRSENVSNAKDSGEFFSPPTKRTPEIFIDFNKGFVSISGRSMPVRPNEFYFPVMRKIEDFIKTPRDTTKVVFNLEYVDSSSAKLLLAIIMRLKKIKERNQLVIQWFYSDDDHDMYELGKAFAELTGCEIDLLVSD